MTGRCLDCRFFSRHTTLVQGPFAGEEWLDLPAPVGDCRRDPPQRNLFGSAFPRVSISDWCGRYEPKETPHA